MRKTAQVLVLSFILLISFISCKSFDNESPDPAYKNKVDFVSLEDGTHHIEYAGEKFVLFSENTVLVELLEEDAFLGWDGSGWGYYDHRYSSRTDNPVFIYETRMDSLFFHEDYDYLTDTFVIDNTTAEIVWRDIFELSQASFDFEEPVQVEIYSKQCPRLKTYLQLVCVENQWYVSLPNSKDVWTVSEAFVKILSENGLI